MDEPSPIYSRCLKCGSKRIKITGQVPFAHDDLVTCLDCGATATYLDFNETNLERIRQMLKEGGQRH